MLTKVSDLTAGMEAGQSWLSTWYKVSMPFIGTQQWVDCGAAVGFPRWQTYNFTPLKAKPLYGSQGHGLWTGPDITAPDQKKYLVDWTMFSGGNGPPCSWMLIDLLMVYPFVDLDSTAVQTMDNTDPLPRYVDGTGVQMAVIAQTPATGGPLSRIAITYRSATNTLRTVTSSLQGSTSNQGKIMCQVPNGNGNGTALPYVQQVGSDPGCRRIESVQMELLCSGSREVAIVLFRPIAQFLTWEITAQNEKNFLRETGNLPSIETDAALSMFGMQTSGAGAVAPILSTFTFGWA